MTNRQVLIESLPTEHLSENNFKIVEDQIPLIEENEVLCRTLLVTIAAGSRAGLQGSASYAGAPQTGVVMNATGVCRIEASKSEEFLEGDLVVCQSGWQDYSSQKATQCQKIVDDVDLKHYLGALGTNGLTAYFGLHRVAQPSPGETLLVSAAAGSVGHLVGQFAKIIGCHTVGIAGSEEKCVQVRKRLGFDKAVSYRSENFRNELKEACSEGVDIYFDNVGGEVLGAALFRMNERGRIVCCGAVSQYDTSQPSGSPRGIPGLLVNKRIRMEGFLVFDFLNEYETAKKEIKQMIADKKILPENDVFDGLAAAPSAFVDLLAGGNIGTRIIKVDD